MTFEILINHKLPKIAFTLSPPQRSFILFIMFFGSLRIVLGVNRDRVLDNFCPAVTINPDNYPKRTEEHYK
jgi:hypothetical protein